MKKITSVLLALFLLSSFAFTALAMPPSVVDNAELLSEEEFNDLTEQLDKIREEYEMDVAVYTENEMSSYSAQASADDIYDYGGYGCGENDDGVLFYICMDTREYHFTTYSYGDEVFNYYALGEIEDTVIEYLSSGDYYTAFAAYADICRELLDSAAQGSYVEEPDYIDDGYYEEDYYYDYDYDYDEVDSELSPVAAISIAIVVSAIIALILTAVQMGKMKTAVKPPNAHNYIKSGGINLTSSRDIYLYSHVSKTAKPKNNSSSGSRTGGGGHVSSSGRSHGGRGGSF